MPLHPEHLLASMSDASCTALRQRFVDHGYTSECIGAAERIAPGALERQRVPLVRYALARDGSPASDLARLFSYADCLPRAHVDELLGAPLVEALVSAGILEASSGPPETLVASMMIQPWEGLWIASDELTPHPEVVMGPGTTTTLLAQMIPLSVTGSALDVGCGAGSFCLLAASRGASLAVGVDVNPRAVAVSAFNARLNGLRAEFHLGDLTAPVQGRRFDRVFAQPPFIARPPEDTASTYMHGGDRGDELAFRLIHELPSVLTPKGRAVVLFDAPFLPGEPLQNRVRASLGQAAVDVLLLSAKGHSADDQALSYASYEAPDLGPLYTAAALRLRSHLDALGINEISLTLLVLDACPGVPGGRYTVTLPVPSIRGVDSGTVDATIDALTLAMLDDRALGAASVSPTDRARFVETRTNLQRDAARSYGVQFVWGSLATDQEVSEAVMVLLEALAEASTVDDALTLYAEACDASADDVRPMVLAFVREWLARGLLVRTDFVGRLDIQCLSPVPSPR